MPVLLRIIVGPYARYGLPEPTHRLWETHPTINSELLQFIKVPMPRYVCLCWDSTRMHTCTRMHERETERHGCSAWPRRTLGGRRLCGRPQLLRVERVRLTHSLTHAH
jgi:hypothetical protein